MKIKIFFLLINFITNLAQYRVSFSSHSREVISVDTKYLETYYKKDDKILYLFNTFDLDKNKYLSFDELFLFQQLTDPQLPLTTRDYQIICRALSADKKYGLDYYQFATTYYELSDQLGTNITKDFNIINKLVSSPYFSRSF